MMSKESCFSMRRNGLQESSFACSIDVQHAPGDWTEQAESKAGIATVSTETPQPPSLSHGELEEVVTAGSERSDSVVHPVPSLTTPVPVTAMPNLEFDVSAVYEHRFKDGSVWYIAKCGPFVLYRRRSDSNFQVKPVSLSISNIIQAIECLYTVGTIDTDTPWRINRSECCKAAFRLG